MSLVGPGDVPDLGVAILARGDQTRVVQPRQPSDLTLEKHRFDVCKISSATSAPCLIEQQLVEPTDLVMG